MRVEDTDSALSAYREAVRGAPESADLAATVARALATTHNFRLALQYYQEAIKKVTDSSLGTEESNVKID